MEIIRYLRRNLARQVFCASADLREMEGLDALKEYRSTHRSNGPHEQRLSPETTLFVVAFERVMGRSSRPACPLEDGVVRRQRQPAEVIWRV